MCTTCRAVQLRSVPESVGSVPAGAAGEPPSAVHAVPEPVEQCHPGERGSSALALLASRCRVPFTEVPASDRSSRVAGCTLSRYIHNSFGKLLEPGRIQGMLVPQSILGSVTDSVWWSGDAKSFETPPPKVLE